MKTKQIISVLLSLLFAMVVGLAFQPILGIHGLATGAVLFGLSFLPMPQGVMRAAVLREA